MINDHARKKPWVNPIYSCAYYLQSMSILTKVCYSKSRTQLSNIKYTGTIFKI